MRLKIRKGCQICKRGTNLSTQDSVNFPEFLHLLRRLPDANFAGIARLGHGTQGGKLAEWGSATSCGQFRHSDRVYPWHPPKLLFSSLQRDHPLICVVLRNIPNFRFLLSVGWAILLRTSMILGGLAY